MSENDPIKIDGINVLMHPQTGEIQGFFEPGVKHDVANIDRSFWYATPFPKRERSETSDVIDHMGVEIDDMGRPVPIVRTGHITYGGPGRLPLNMHTEPLAPPLHLNDQSEGGIHNREIVSADHLAH